MGHICILFTVVDNIWYQNGLFQCYLVSLFQNVFHLKMNLICMKCEPVGPTHFHMNGFTLRLVLTQRQIG